MMGASPPPPEQFFNFHELSGTGFGGWGERFVGLYPPFTARAYSISLLNRIYKTTSVECLLDIRDRDSRWRRAVGVFEEVRQEYILRYVDPYSMEDNQRSTRPSGRWCSTATSTSSVTPDRGEAEHFGQAKTVILGSRMTLNQKG